MTLRTAAATAVAVTAGALTAGLLAGCGSAPAQVVPDRPATPAASLPIATSVAGLGHASWAVVQVGGSSADHDNFWELLVRPAGALAWQLATPPGVASNGGLVVAGTSTSLVAGFRPSQLLTFSPLATTANQGKSWAQGNLLSPGLAATPDALAAGPDGQLLALTDTGTVRLGSHLGASWRTVTSGAALAGTAAARACGLTSLSAVAFNAAGTPMVAGSCRTAGVVGLFNSAGGGWQPAGLTLPAALGRVTVSVLGLATFGDRTTALLAVGHGASAGIVAAWLAGTATTWTFSPLLRASAAAVASLSLWPGGAAGLVLAGGRGETIAAPGASWRQLAPLPAHTATLALGPAGQPEAIASQGATATAWQLGPAGWNALQTIKIQIPYGSSG